VTINGDKSRYKLRLRFYNDQPDSPVFFEVKRRVNDVIFKMRGGARKEAVPVMLAGQLPDPSRLVSQDPKHLFAIQKFMQLQQDLQATPKLHVAHQREAWIDPKTEAVRVTFDRHVLGEPEPTTRFSTHMNDSVRPFGDGVILELKFTDRFPNWMRELAETFDLVQCGAAKYCECIKMIGEERLADLVRNARI